MAFLLILLYLSITCKPLTFKTEFNLHFTTSSFIGPVGIKNFILNSGGIRCRKIAGSTCRY